MSRRRFSEREVIETIIGMGNEVRCFRCHLPFVVNETDKIEREHFHEVALGGPDIPANCGYSHKACHKTVTDGTRATSAGSSKHRIAKAKRISKGGKTRRGPKMQSRPWPKRAS